MISFFVPEVFKFSYYANLVTDDVISCASTGVWHKITNISINKEAMLLKLGRDVPPYEIYHMVHILMLLWQHARFQSPASSKWNITICNSTSQNICSYMYLRHKSCQSHLHWVSSLTFLTVYFALCSYKWQYLVSSVDRAPVCCAGEVEGSNPRTDQHSGSWNNWGECAAFVIISANG